MPFVDKRSGNRKRIIRAVSTANREIKHLKQKNEELKRKLKTVQKQWQRERKRKSKEPNTPRRQTETEMMEAGLNPEQRTKVRKQPLMGMLCYLKSIKPKLQQGNQNRKNES